MFLFGFINSANLPTSFILLSQKILTPFSVLGTWILPEDLVFIIAFSNAHCSNLKFLVSQHMKWSGNKSRQIRILLTTAFFLFNLMKKYPSHFIHTS